MRKNLLKIFTTIITISFILSAFAACKNSVLDYNRVSDGKNLNNADKAIISFRVDEKNLQRSTNVIDVKEEDIVKVSLNVELYNTDEETKLVMGEDTLSFTESEDGTKSPIDVFEENILYLDPGTYKFTVFLYVNDLERGDYVVQTGELNKITVKSGENAPLLFKTNYKAFGDISVNFKFSFEDLPVGSTDAEITAAKAKIMAYHVNAGLFYEIDKEGTQGVINPVNYKKDDGEEIYYGFEKVVFEEDDITITKNDDNEDIWTVNINYSKNDVPNGSYYICFEILEEDPSDPALQYRRNIYIDIAKIKGYKTTGECKLSNTNTVFNVNYDLNGGEWVEEAYKPATHSTNQAIYLPSSDDIKRKGYDFVGWLDKDLYREDSSYNLGTTDISAGKECARDYNLKAQWRFNRELFVTNSGNDANDGLSLDSAFASLQKAIDFIKDYERNEDDCIEGFQYTYELKNWTINVSGNIGTSANPSVTVISDISSTQAESILIRGMSKNTLDDGTYDTNSYIDVLDACSDSQSDKYNGSVITIDTLVPVTIQNIKITGGYNKDGNGGGIYVKSGSHTIGEGTLITGNTAETGGGLYIGDEAGVYMTGGEITGNVDNYGSEVFHSGSVFSMSGTAVIKQMVGADGGLIGSGAIFLNNVFDSDGNISGVPRTVTIDGALTTTLSTGEKIAKIKANKYIPEMTILSSGEKYTVTSEIVNKFAMAESGYALEYSDNTGKLKSSSTGGNVIVNDSILDISITSEELEQRDAIYLNKGTIIFSAKLRGTQTDVSTDSGITWTAKLLYGGRDLNEYAEDDDPYYEFYNSFAGGQGGGEVPVILPATKAQLNLAKTLEVSGNYQLYVTATYKADANSSAITSSQTFNIPVDKLYGYSISIDKDNYPESGEFESTFSNSFQKALDESEGNIEIELLGNTYLSDIAEMIEDADREIILDLSTCTFDSATVTANKFTENDNIVTLKLPCEENTYITTIEASSFSGLSGLKEIYIPNTVETIGVNAFPSSLEKFVIVPVRDDDGNDVPDEIFYSTDEEGSMLIKTVYDDNSGENVTSIEFVVEKIKEGITSLDFASDSINGIDLSNINEIGYGAFNGCENLTSVNLSGNITKIHPEAFANSGLTSVSISAGVTFDYSKQESGSGNVNKAFSNCENLDNVTIAAGMSSEIKYDLFYNCNSISSFTIDGTYGSNQNTKYYALMDGALLVKQVTNSQNNTTTNSVVLLAPNDENTQIDFSSTDDSDGLALSEISEIGEFALSDKITTVKLGNVKRIKTKAFNNSTNLETVDLTGVIDLTIEQDAFPNAITDSESSFAFTGTEGDFWYKTHYETTFNGWLNWLQDSVTYSESDPTSDDYSKMDSSNISNNIKVWINNADRTYYFLHYVE